MNQPSVDSHDTHDPVELEAVVLEEVPPPPSSQPRSVPPPLPASASTIPAARLEADDAFAARMIERLAAGDYQGALLAAESLLEFRPLDPDASDTALIARGELRRLYIERLGSLERVPHLSVPIEGLLSHPWVDARSAFVLGRIDGVATVREVVEGTGMHATDGLRLLSELVLRRAVTLDDRDAR
jgi:hypothetical protein